MKEPTERVVVSRAYCGLCYMQVCAVANATDEEILKVANRDNPCGTTNGWLFVLRDPKEHNMPDETKPGPCNDFPGRIHFLVGC